MIKVIYYFFFSIFRRKPSTFGQRQSSSNGGSGGGFRSQHGEPPQAASALPPAKAQGRQKTEDPFHLAAAPRPGEQVQREAVPLHLWARRILQESEIVWNSSEDLVPESPCQVQATSRGRDWQGQAGSQSQCSPCRPLRHDSSFFVAWLAIVTFHARPIAKLKKTVLEWHLFCSIHTFFTLFRNHIFIQKKVQLCCTVETIVD